MNDNDQSPMQSLWSGPDPHGQAALLLVESLLHGLIEKRTLTIEEAVVIVDIAADVKAEIAADIGDAPHALQKSLSLLKSIAASLRHDLDGR
ncbi:hypothetical protein HZF05_14175 [Sphingomonas sp. CGMCC 1.13654]|uniref:Uncharacterized protein n=1 Tax=Sphingomonas chungangi TaxID=2683589 RepID=A0A838L7D5_9SPHN|nr:hypothetical protein [Sphingomonas chungangi]MBA2935231.1 hypothetical protein [Sphingomonas chungangi]MVW55309.1 hypothetical protein [Sphingomonas chungangi]